AQHQYSFGL
nr:allatostatin:ISOTYPE=A1 [Gryllus bimaculatus]